MKTNPYIYFAPYLNQVFWFQFLWQFVKAWGTDKQTDRQTDRRNTEHLSQTFLWFYELYKIFLSLLKWWVKRGNLKFKYRPTHILWHTIEKALLYTKSYPLETVSTTFLANMWPVKVILSSMVYLVLNGKEKLRSWISEKLLQIWMTFIMPYVTSVLNTFCIAGQILILQRRILNWIQNQWGRMY